MTWPEISGHSEEWPKIWTFESWPEVIRLTRQNYEFSNKLIENIHSKKIQVKFRFQVGYFKSCVLRVTFLTKMVQYHSRELLSHSLLARSIILKLLHFHWTLHVNRTNYSYEMLLNSCNVIPAVNEKILSSLLLDNEILYNKLLQLSSSVREMYKFYRFHFWWDYELMVSCFVVLLGFNIFDNFQCSWLCLLYLSILLKYVFSDRIF